MYMHVTKESVGYVLYSLHVCVCVGASDSTTASDDPSSSDFCVVCIRHFLGGSQEGGAV